MILKVSKVSKAKRAISPNLANLASFSSFPICSVRTAYSAFAACALLLTAWGPAALSEEDEYGIEHPAGYKAAKPSPSSSKRSTSSSASSYDPDYPTAITSIEAMRMGTVDSESNSTVLMMVAEYNLKNGHVEEAMKAVKIALDRNYDDVDVHKVYAEVLERKYNQDPKKDPDVYNNCVMQWLIVMRQEVGWEKLSNSNGLAIPGMGKRFEDEDQTIPARHHLIQLTGSVPKVSETDYKWLKKVLKPTTTGVKGKILGKDDVPEDFDPDRPNRVLKKDQPEKKNDAETKGDTAGK
jgi:hypothetical protein